MNKLKIESVVFCEQIRVEMGGKHTLLGATAPELNIGQIPATIPVSIWVTGTPSGLGPFEADFRAVGVNGTNLVTAKINGEFSALSKTSMVVGGFPLLIEAAGDYSFEWNFGDTQWDKIGMIRFHYVPNDPAIIPFPNVKKQPS